MRPEAATRDESCKPRSVQVSSCYKVARQGNSSSLRILIEHCCLMTKGNTWHIVIKCRPLQNHDHRSKTEDDLTVDSWRNVVDVFPDAKVEDKHNDIEVTLPPLPKDIEVAAFGTPGENDQKRMQMAIFGKRPTQGKDWKIRVYLLDDTITAVKQLCEKEEMMGNRRLTALAGLFVSNSDEDIRIEFTALEPGWQIKGGTVKAIKAKDVWNSPENATDFPCCDFLISHIDQTKQQFFCGITASHGLDSANTEVVSLFEQTEKKDVREPSEALKRVKTAIMNFLIDTTTHTSRIFDLLSHLAGATGLSNKTTKGAVTEMLLNWENIKQEIRC